MRQFKMLNKFLYTSEIIPRRCREFDGLDWMWVGTRTQVVDRIGLCQWVCRLGWISSSKMDPCPTLRCI